MKKWQSVRPQLDEQKNFSYVAYLRFAISHTLVDAFLTLSISANVSTLVLRAAAL
jgi:hypothetical protein